MTRNTQCRPLGPLAAVGCALCAPPAFAQSRVPADPPVSEVVVTATRLPQSVDVVPGAFVIDQDKIAQLGALTAADALKTAPGLTVYQTGAFGGVTAVRIRGASADKTLVLVDGVPVDDPSDPSGAFDFGGFDVADVSRMEILSGPQSSLWGSSAIGGVISITTREPDGLRASAQGGSYRTGVGSLSLGRSRETWALGFSASAISTHGISSADAVDGNSERDGFHTHSFGLNARIDPSPAVVIDAKARWQAGETGIDGYVYDPSSGAYRLGDTNDVMRRDSWQGYVRASLNDLWGFRQQLSLSAYRIARSDTGQSGDYGYTADRRVVRWQAERTGGNGLWGLAFGAEREAARAELSDASRQSSADSSAFLVGRLNPIRPLTLSASLRWDDARGYHPVATGRAAATLALPAGFELQGSWGQGFKTPTISETACDFCFPTGPALKLRPERAEGVDAGLNWRSEDQRFSAGITAWRLSVRDQIDFYFDPGDFSFRYRNLNRTRSRGAQAQAAADLGHGFRVEGNATWTDAVDVSTGLPLLRIPPRQGSAIVSWAGKRAHASVIVRAESAQPDVGPFGTQDRRGFVTADLASGLRLTEAVELTLRVVNLANVHWQEALGYGEPRRAGWLGVRLRY